MYLLARELTGRRDAAFLAGLIFAFSPMRALHVSHLQVLAWGWMPIALVGPAPVHGGRERPAPHPRGRRARGLRRRVHHSGVLERLLSLLPGDRVGVRRDRRARVAFDVRRGSAARRSAGWRSPSALILAVRRRRRLRRTCRCGASTDSVRPYDDWTMFSANLRSYVSAPSSARVSGRSCLHGDDVSRASAVSRSRDSDRRRGRALARRRTPPRRDSVRRAGRGCPRAVARPRAGRLVASTAAVGDRISGSRGSFPAWTACGCRPAWVSSC